MKQHQTLRRGLGILISLIMCLGLLPVTALAEETSTNVEISEANFPDANFRNFVKDYDLDDSNSLSEEEIAKVTDMNCNGIAAATLEGIEYFTALENLRCVGNFIEELDLSKNINLKSLVCNYNSHLTKLNINNCTKLESVECTNSGLTSLDLSDNTALKSLYCHSNNITELKNIKNTKLENLGCSNNAITELNLDGVLTLKRLYCSNNKLTYLNLSNTNVSDFGCGGNSYTVTIDENREFDLTKLPGGNFDVSQASNWAGGEPNENILKVAENAIEVTYDYNCGKSITGSFTLKIIDPADDANGIEINEENFPDDVFRQYVLDNCDASENGKLSKKEIADTKSIDFYNSNIENVSNLKGIENFTALEELNCWGNKLTSIDLSKNTELKTLNCGRNYLTVLDLSSNTKLENLYCFDNKLTSLDLSNTNITSSSKFDADGNCVEIILADNDERTFELSTLSGGKFDVNNVTDLEGGSISGTTLNINENATEVTYNYNCGKDRIVKFTIKVYDQGTVRLDSINFPDANFRNYVFQDIDKNQDSILSADEMDAVKEILCPPWDFADLKGIEYFKNLKILYCSYNELTTLDVSKNTALEELYCDSNELTSLNVSGNKALKLLTLGNNKLTSLDVSENAALEELDCSDNELTSLDVSENTELTNLDCAYNKLTSLNVGSNTKLESLYCYDNGLTSLDVSSNEYLSTLSCSGNQLTYLDLSNTQVSSLSASNNVYEITLDDDRTFDLSKLPGGKFNVANVSSYDDSIGTVDKATAVLTLFEGKEEFTYSYKCGKDKYIDFTLKVSGGGGDTDDTTKYTVTANGLYGTAMGITPGDTYTNDYAAGEEVKLQVGAREGYTLKDLTLVGISEDDIEWTAEGVETDIRGITFTMPEKNVTITVNWTANGSGEEGGGGSSSGGSSGGGGGGGSVKKYSVTASENIENGTVTISPKNASAGSKVTVTVTPDEGFALESLVIKDKNGKEIKLTDNGNGKYTFTMPSGKVTVEASFKAETPEFVEPEKTAGAENPFTDVSADAYYYDAVLWAVEKGITSGTTETTFSPDASCTRAQMLTFMWRAAGSPKATGSNPFTDVSADAYYYDAVLWAVENGITSGISATTFAPDATVTRDQTVTFLYRMAGSPAANGSSFSDMSSDAYYADAVAWAVQQNITSGTGDGQFSPNADCTRAQIVTFLYRCMG